MVSFKEIIHIYKLKNEVTSNIKFQQVLFFLNLNDVEISLRDGLFSYDIGIVNLHPSQGTHWVI